MRWVGPVVAALVALGSARADAAGDVRAAARKVLERPGIQRTLPAAGSDSGSAAGTEAGARRHGAPDDDEPLFAEAPSEFMRQLARVLLWGMAAAGLALVVAWLVSELRGGTGKAPAATADAPAPSAVPAGSPTLPDPTALAAAGRWDEAVHALLLASVQALAARERIPDALTSRELLGGVPDAARPPLAALVGHVERSLFAGVPATAAIFAEASDQHAAFRAALAGGRR